MGRPTGFEPVTSGTTNRRSNQLSYDRHTPLPAYHQTGICQARAKFGRITHGGRAVKCAGTGGARLAQRTV